MSHNEGVLHCTAGAVLPHTSAEAQTSKFGSPDASERLIELCRQSFWHPDLSELQACVRDGADVMRNTRADDASWAPVLMHFVESGQREAVLRCLTGNRPVNFNVTGRLHTTLLHTMAFVNTSLGEAYNREVTRAVVRRLETHPEDVVNWGQVDFLQSNFLTHAAHNQLLHVLWPEVKEVPYFADQVEPIAVRGEVWAWDWEALGEVEQQRFNFDKAQFVECDVPTAHLHKLMRTLRPDEDTVRRYVEGGADVMFTHRNVQSHRPLLTDALRHSRSAALVQILLESSVGIDFTLTDYLGRTPLHAICAWLETVPVEAPGKRKTDVLGANRELSGCASKRGGALARACLRQHHGGFLPRPGGKDAREEVRDAPEASCFSAFSLSSAASAVKPMPPLPDHPAQKLVHPPSPSSRRVNPSTAQLLREEEKPSSLLITTSSLETTLNKVEALLRLARSPDTPRRQGAGRRTGEGTFTTHAKERVSTRTDVQTPVDSLGVLQGTPTRLKESAEGEEQRHRVASLLRLVVDRLESHHEDKVKWDQEDQYHKEAIDYAAERGYLDIWIHVLVEERQVPYFVDFYTKSCQ